MGCQKHSVGPCLNQGKNSDGGSDSVWGFIPVSVHWGGGGGGVT